MSVPVVVSRILLLVFSAFAVFINQFSSERIENFLHSIPYRCPLRWITGWKCAFCGMTHSWIAMFRGDVSTAFSENLFGPVLWLGTIVLLVIFSVPKLQEKLSFRPKLVAGFVLILMVYAVLRNLL